MGQSTKYSTSTIHIFPYISRFRTGWTLLKRILVNHASSTLRLEPLWGPAFGHHQTCQHPQFLLLQVWHVPYFGGVEESQVYQDSLFEVGRPHIGWPHWLQDFRESCVKCDCWVRDQRGSLLESHQARTHHHLSGGYHCLPWAQTLVVRTF